MRPTAFIGLFVAAIFSAPIEAPAQAPLATEHSFGRQIALEQCGTCHRVTAGQLRPRQNVPSFFAIANLPSTTPLSLRVFLRSNHNGMPNLIVSEADTTELIDYILSLKRR